MSQTKSTSSTNKATVKLSGMVIFYNADHGYGQINTADGRRWHFDYNAISGTWVPGAGDFADFELIEGQSPDEEATVRSIYLVEHRDAETAGRDDLIECPHCHKSVYPRIVDYEGVPDVSYCPECGKVIAKFGRNDRIFWIMLAVAVFVSVAVGLSVS